MPFAGVRGGGVCSAFAACVAGRNAPRLLDFAAARVSRAKAWETARGRECLIQRRVAVGGGCETLRRFGECSRFLWSTQGHGAPRLPPRRGLAAESAARLKAVRRLRERTGVSVGECQKALKEAEWSEEEAVQLLRRRNVVKSAGESGVCRGREGVVAVAFPSSFQAEPECLQPPFAVVVLKCQTDFVARNADFLFTAKALAAQALALKTSDAALLKTAPLPEGNPFQVETARELLAQQSAKFGEVLDVTDSYTPETAPALAQESHVLRIAEVYVHSELAPGVGQVAAAVEATFSLKAARGSLGEEGGVQARRRKLRGICRLLAMQAVALRPKFLDRESISESVKERERKIIAAAASHAASVPSSDAATEKQLLRLENIKSAMEKRFFQETVFMEQEFLMQTQLQALLEAPPSWIPPSASVADAFKKVEELTGVTVSVSALRVFDAHSN